MIFELCKGVHCVDLGDSFQTHIYLQTLAPIQPLERAPLPSPGRSSTGCREGRPRRPGPRGHGENAFFENAFSKNAFSKNAFLKNAFSKMHFRKMHFRKMLFFLLFKTRGGRGHFSACLPASRKMSNAFFGPKMHVSTQKCVFRPRKCTHAMVVSHAEKRAAGR